jgi:hypothetical protein
MRRVEQTIIRSDFEKGIEIMKRFLAYEAEDIVPNICLDRKLERALEKKYDTQSLRNRIQLANASKRKPPTECIRDYTPEELKDVARRLHGMNPVLGIPLNADELAVDRYTK